MPHTMETLIILLSILYLLIKLIKNKEPKLKLNVLTKWFKINLDIQL